MRLYRSWDISSKYGMGYGILACSLEVISYKITGFLLLEIIANVFQRFMTLG
jgi:hypothetical protein